MTLLSQLAHVELITPALGHIGWRAASPETLEIAADRLAQLGMGEGWTDGDAGHGRAYRFHGPGRDLEEVFWEVERFRAEASSSRSSPAARQRFRPRGAAARQIDHASVGHSWHGSATRLPRDPTAVRSAPRGRVPLDAHG